MQISLLTVVTMILVLVSASAETSSLRGGSMNHVGENGSDGGDCSDESCGSPISYGEAYHIQLVSRVSRWLTNSRNAKGSDGRPRSGYGRFARTEDCADKGGSNECTSNQREVDPDQYRWIIGSDESDGSRFDDNGQVIYEDPKRKECMRYGDIIYLQGAGQDNHWLTGGRGRGNTGVYMVDIAAQGKWLLRSAAVRNQNDPDPRVGQCVRSKDQVYFQSSVLSRWGTEVDDIYLTGGRNQGTWDVETRDSSQASQFELQLAPSESPSSSPSDSPSSNEDTIDSLRATIADLAATVISLEESIVQKDSIIADLSFQLDANCVPIDPTPSPTPPTVTPSIAPTKAPTSAQSLTPTNAPSLVPSATSTVAPWTSYQQTSCEGTKATIRSISGNYRPKVLSNCKSTCEYYDECVGFNYWDDNEVQTTECVFYSDITATPAKSYESEGRQDYITSYCYVQSHKLLSLSSSSGVNKYEREGWSRILASDPIRESSTTDIDSTISIMFDWKDQGRGNRKGKVRVLLLSNDGTIVAQKTYQYAPQNWETQEEILNLDHDLVNLARVGHSYAVEVMAGWGGGHVLYLRGFELETNFASV